MDPNLAALQTMHYHSQQLKDLPLGFLPNQGDAEIRKALIADAQKKYDTITHGWYSRNTSPLKPFGQCTWNEIESAFNGDSSKLVNACIPAAKY
ncbi:MAG: hypothetical protein AMXMBFR12_09160 [Candidatus Babeliales bacterium]